MDEGDILANLPDGYQACGIQVDSASIAGGWASLPGSKVNILWTMRGMDKKVRFQAPAGRRHGAGGRWKFHPARRRQGHAGQRGDRGPENHGFDESQTGIVVRALDVDPENRGHHSVSGRYPVPCRRTLLPQRSLIVGEESRSARAASIIPPPVRRSIPTSLPVLPSREKAKNDGPTPPVTQPDVPQPPEAKGCRQRYYHVFTARQGEKRTRQVIEVDAAGVPIQDDAARLPGTGAAATRSAIATGSPPPPPRRKARSLPVTRSNLVFGVRCSVFGLRQEPCCLHRTQAFQTPKQRGAPPPPPPPPPPLV